MKRYFPSTYSLGYKIGSAISLTFIVVLICSMGEALFHQQLELWEELLMGFLSLLFASMSCYNFCARIKGIEIDGKTVEILQQKGRTIIRREDITRTERLKSIGWDRSIWSLGLVFGQIGWYSKKQLGKYFALVNNGNNLVAIHTRKKCYVISCDEPEKLMEILAEK